SASIVAGSIDESKLDTSVNASLDLADSSVQNLTDLGITADATELNYVDGVTSAIQTQLNGKQATITGGASTIVSSNLTTARALVSDGSGKVDVSGVTTTELDILDGAIISTTELNYLDNVTSNVQTQLNSKLESGDAVMGTIVHGATAGTARPSGFDV